MANYAYLQSHLQKKDKMAMTDTLLMDTGGHHGGRRETQVDANIAKSIAASTVDADIHNSILGQFVKKSTLK